MFMCFDQNQINYKELENILNTCTVNNNGKKFSGFKKSKHKVYRIYWSKKVVQEDVQENVEYTFKYKEEISFIKESSLSKTAVCIGYNPAKAEDEIDTTNKRLIDLLWDDYDGYILYNFYPQVSSDKDTCNLDLEENENFIHLLSEVIKKEESDIILFWGRSVNIDKKIKLAIEARLRNNKVLKITTFKNEFKHPGAHGGCVLKELKSGDTYIHKQTTYRIVLNSNK